MNRFLLIFANLLLLLPLIAEAGEFQDTSQRTWYDHSRGILDLDMKTIDVDGTGQRILAASDRSVYRSTDGGRTWQMVLKFTAGFEPETAEAEVEEDVDEPPEFDRSDYDADDLFRSGILEEGEEFDDIDDEDLRERLEDAGLLEYDTTGQSPRESAPVPDSPETDEYRRDRTHQIRWDPVDNRFAYLATDRGFFVSRDGGNSWTETRTGMIQGRQSVTGVVVLHPSGTVLIAVDEGLRVSMDHGGSFTDYPADIFGGSISDLESDATQPDTAVCSGENGVFLLTATGSVRKISLAPSAATEDVRAVGIEDGSNCFISRANRLAYLKQDGSWSEIPTATFGGMGIRDIDVSPFSVAVAGSRGVYVWDRLTASGGFKNAGLTDTDIRDIVICKHDRHEFWVATASGVFALKPSGMTAPGTLKTTALQQAFPGINEVMTAALLFAESNLARDSRWVRRSKQRDLFPLVDLEADYYDLNSEGYGGSDVTVISGGTPYIGPIDEVYQRWNDNRFDISLRLKWYPGFSVFNNDDLKIRERIGREAVRRQELLDTVRRTYFAFLAESARSTEMTHDLRTQVQASLMVQELQARLDALTGFKFEEMAPQ